MKTLRNLSFVVMAMAFVVASSAHPRALGEGSCTGGEGFMCPAGCYYSTSCVAGNDYLVLNCPVVESCEETYPTFCSDFFSFCYNEQCRMVWNYGCGTVGGACDAECECGGASGCYLPA